MPPGGAEAAVCVRVSGLPGPEAKFWAFLGTTSILPLLACLLLAFSLIPIFFISRLRIQQRLKGAVKGGRSSLGKGSSAPGGHSSCWKLWVFLGESGPSSQRPEKGNNPPSPISVPGLPLTWPLWPAAARSSPGALAAAAPAGPVAAPPRPPAVGRALSPRAPAWWAGGSQQEAAPSRCAPPAVGLCRCWCATEGTQEAPPPTPALAGSRGPRRLLP